MSEEPRAVQRTSDVQESTWAEAILYLAPGVLGIIVGIVGLRYGGVFIGLGWVGIILGGGATLFGLYKGFSVRKVEGVGVECVFCKHKNMLTFHPQSDFRCDRCQRMVPVLNGVILPVEQVRCGYCNHLNYYSEKTEVLLCEECNREVPIQLADDRVTTKRLAQGFAVQDDPRPYELRLLEGGPKTEEMIQTLQRMLALNRNQVKQILDEVPVTLLTGIPRKKAEMLQAQLTAHDARSEIRPME